jgi:hypothetical protein
MVMMVLRSRAESYRDQKSRERPCVSMMMSEPDFPSSSRALFHALEPPLTIAKSSQVLTTCQQFCSMRGVALSSYRILPLV